MGSREFGSKPPDCLPKKVRLMFDAVVELIGENADITSIKVSDITARAGIGKGTVYEYFSSKEELITTALIAEYAKKITELRALIGEQGCFPDKIYCILDWLNGNRGYHMSFVRMIQIMTGRPDVFQSIRDRIPDEKFWLMHNFLGEDIDSLMEQGYREGIYTETDLTKRRMAMVSMVFQFVLTLGDKTEDSIFVMDYEVLRPYVYDTMVKTLR